MTVQPETLNMASLTAGSGPLLLFLPGLTPHHRQPTGSDKAFQLGQMRAFSGTRRVWWVQRRQGLRPGVSMGDLADDYAVLLRARGHGPVDVLGSSTGGSVALQLALDHPRVVRRLVLVSSACRLGPAGRAGQRQVLADLRSGRRRRAGATLMRLSGASTTTRGLFAGLGWLAPGLAAGEGDPDMLATIEAEDAFDVTDRLGDSEVPTLVVGGDRDGFYGEEVFRATADGLPRGQLALYRGKGHVGTQTTSRLARDVEAFLRR